MSQSSLGFVQPVMELTPGEGEPVSLRGVPAAGHLSRGLGWGLGLALCVLMIATGVGARRANPPFAMGMSLAILAIPTVVSLLGFLRVLREAFGFYELRAAGIVRRFVGFEDRILWSDVVSIDLDRGMVFDIAGRTLRARSRGAMETDLLPAVRALRRRGLTGSGRRRVPLFLQHVIGPKPWMWLSVLMLLIGAMCVLAGFRPPVTAEGLWVAGILVAAGLVCLALSLHQSTEQVVFRTDRICRATCLGRREILWADVELLSIRGEERRRPYHGRAAIRSFRGTVRFRTRPQAFTFLGRYLDWACRNAFFLDDASGQMTPPTTGDIATIRQRFLPLSRQVSRRYYLIAFLQALAVPLMSLLWLVALFGGFAFLGCMPFEIGDIAANVRKARVVRRCCREHVGGA